MTTTTKIRHLLLCVLAAACPFSAISQQKKQSTLVAAITVEGLSGEYLRLLEPVFSEGGFKKLMHSGATIDRLDFGPGLDHAAASTVVFSGASPIVNGVPSDKIYDTSTKLPKSPLHAPSMIGNFTDETLSPEALKVSTVADELRIDSDGEGRVFAVAPKSTTALVGAAHAGNGAYWINNMTANWATTAYYKEMPVPIRDRNYLNPLANRLDSMKWTPLLNLSLYPGITASEMRKPFRQTFPRKEVNRVSRFIESPLANTEVTDVASDLITALSLGSGKSTDMITIGYTLPSDGSRAEIIDSYIRLDRDLERLFHILERACQNSTGPTIMLAGLPSNAGSAPDDKRWNIPSGLYSVKRAVSLLGIHLMSVHGNGDWITGYHDRHFFLNRQLIKDRGLNLQDFRREVADFLGRMAGICNVITIDDILASRAGDNPDALKRNTSFTHAGDVIIEISPGWQIIDDGTGRASGALRHTAVDIPAFFIAPGLKRLHITESTDARTLAPTLSRLLLIRAPNGASVPALNL